jgi:hypothetical protein
MPGYVLMPRIDIITDGGFRCRWSATEKLRIVEEAVVDGLFERIPDEPGMRRKVLTYHTVIRREKASMAKATKATPFRVAMQMKSLTRVSRKGFALAPMRQRPRAPAVSLVSASGARPPASPTRCHGPRGSGCRW